MKNYFKVLSMMAIALLVVMTSCKKDEETKTDQDYLTAGNWKVTGMEISPGIEVPGFGTVTDFYQYVEACTKDDLLRFNTDGVLIEDEGATKCDADDPQTTSDGTWTLVGTTLTISYPNEDPEAATLVSINSSTMVTSVQETIDLGFGPNTVTATITMTLQ